MSSGYHQFRSGNETQFKIARVNESFRNAIRVLVLVWDTNKPLTLLLSTITVTNALVPAASVWVFGAILNQAELLLRTNSSDPRQILQLIGLHLAIMIIGFILRTSGIAIRALLGDLFTNRTNLMILEKSESLDISYFENAAFYDRLENAQREAREGPLQIVSESFAIAQNAITLLTMMALLFTLSWWVVLVVLITTIPALGIEVKFSRERFQLQTWRSPTVRRLAYFRWLITNDDYIKELRIFNLGRYLISIYRNTFDQFFSENASLTIRSSRAALVLQILGAIGSASVFIYITIQVLSRNLGLGAIGIFYQAYQATVDATTQLLQSVTSIYERGLFVNNFFEFLEFEPLISDFQESLELPSPITKGIVFSDVHFTYPGTDEVVLNGLNLTLHPKETVAIVGANGAGKTTIIKLLARFYDVDKGSITIDGRDIRDYSITDLRKNVGIIFQDYGRYQESAGINVGYGSLEDIDDDQKIKAAAKKSGADKVIDRLPEKYDTQLGRWFKRGTNLSIGQWQKIALARGYMRDGQIFIQDKPTSSLDVESEHEVFDRFQELSQNRIAILISHRFTTVRMADRIIVLQDGQVLEQGSHEHLVSLKGKYSKLFEMQASAYR